MMMITAFGATKVPGATTKIILTITEIRNDQKNNSNNQLILVIFHRFIKRTGEKAAFLKSIENF